MNSHLKRPRGGIRRKLSATPSKSWGLDEDRLIKLADRPRAYNAARGQETRPPAGGSRYTTRGFLQNESQCLLCSASREKSVSDKTERDEAPLG
ncbi:hypothetical protein VM1G_11291 [Cytospora mali]|uniref:Uncharacterized protein n=1 Tax=Cytospora mali TaxID=578113 RepID=A0A194VLE1_CYTMA|nr:hypothetical protein VM1G_11291 [Valsa mali]